MLKKCAAVCGLIAGLAVIGGFALARPAVAQLEDPQTCMMWYSGQCPPTWIATCPPPCNVPPLT